METIKQQLEAAKKEVARLRKLNRTMREPIVGTLGGVIQRLREERGYGIRELALKSGHHPPVITRLETQGDPNVTLNTLLPIAEALEVPLSKMIELWEAEKK